MNQSNRTEGANALLDLLESKINDKTITAAEMTVYFKALKDGGYKYVASEAPKASSIAESLPFDDDDEDPTVLQMPR